MDRIAVDRQRGALVGLAVGDALGAAVEFEPPGTFLQVTGFRGGGPHELAPEYWTDDTSMALALADSIASVGWDLNDQARRYVAWWRKGDPLALRHPERVHFQPTNGYRSATLAGRRQSEQLFPGNANG